MYTDKGAPKKDKGIDWPNKGTWNISVLLDCYMYQINLSQLLFAYLLQENCIIFIKIKQ
jgi:hypothetical protein